jgi:CSLREA domain-containing protein
VTLLSTIVANNSAHSGNDIKGTIASGNYCLVEDPNGASISGANNITGVDPMLAPPAYDGGSTETMALLLGSPAIDKGKNSNGLADDQRGQPRTVNDLTVADAVDGDGADIGAVESNYLVVNTTAQDDDGTCQPLPGGDCTLREAILAANAAPGTETIIFDIPTADPGYDAGADRFTIALTSVLPELDSDMSINGLGAKHLTVKRNAAAPFRIFAVSLDRTVTISGLTISGGEVDTTSTHCTFYICPGGGIANFGTLTVLDSAITENYAPSGGGLSNDLGHSLTVLRSMIANNNGGDGGAIFDQGTMSIIDSTLSGNSAGRGGAISRFTPAGPDNMCFITNSTINDNSALYYGGGISGNIIVLNSSIVANNTAGFDGPDISGEVIAGDYNIVQNSDGTLPGTHNTTGVDPKLGPLQDNGGQTLTHAPLCGSPAIDAGVANALATDQRGAGFARTFDDPAMANAAGGDGTDIGAFELQAPLTCNTAPVANPDSFTINEDPASPVTFNVLANDTDADNDVLTTQVVQAAAHGSLSTNGDGSLSYFPSSNFNGTDSFTYSANDGSLDSNVATVTIVVNPVNDAPIVSATPKTQTRQYSDAISTVTINASDVETPAANLLIAFSYSKDGGASQAGLPTGMVQGGAGGAWTVSGVAGVPQGAYVVTATVTDTGDGSAAATSSSDTFTIVVTRENAVAAPKASNPVSMQVGSPGGTASGTTGQICFDITEPSDGSPGNTALIDSATVTINAVGGGGAGGVSASARTFSGGSVGGTRTACFTLNFAGVAPNVFEVTLVIGGNYYTGSGTTVFTVFDPSSGFASGGGWIINPNNGYRANYGVNIKYLKSGSAQGSLLYIEHRPNGDYKVKSTSLNSKGGFAIVPITGGAEADIAGKGNYVVNDVGTGNYSFIARVIDKGTPGTNDQFGLKLIDPLGQVVIGFTFNPVTLGGGNNQVPKK